MDKYNKLIAKSTNTTMIHVSLDKSEDAAETWATEAKLPWLTVLPDDVEKSKLHKFKKTQYVPEYNLVSKDGEILASGADACFKKIKELSKSAD